MTGKVFLVKALAIGGGDNGWQTGTLECSASMVVSVVGALCQGR